MWCEPKKPSENCHLAMFLLTLCPSLVTSPLLGLVVTTVGQGLCASGTMNVPSAMALSTWWSKEKGNDWCHTGN